MITQEDIDHFENFRTHYIFDVDGTLTPSRGKIDKEFKSFFNSFCLSNNVYLVTGSDKPKTVEQIGKDTYNLCKRVYNCSGAEVWEGETNTYTSDWKPSGQQMAFLMQIADLSPYPYQYGKTVEVRTGMVNFSVVGRGAVGLQRTNYYKWDCEHREREKISRLIKTQYPELTAVVGGETGIDVFPNGGDKSQILRDFLDTDMIYFFGDRLDPAGNDRPLADAIVNGKSIHVKDWRDTYKTLLGMVE